MKTDKFNNMISAFTCDFSLARENNKHSCEVGRPIVKTHQDNGFKLADLDTEIKNGNERLNKDIDLLEELEFLLRTGQAEIHIVK